MCTTRKAQNCDDQPNSNGRIGKNWNLIRHGNKVCLSRILAKDYDSEFNVDFLLLDKFPQLTPSSVVTKNKGMKFKKS